MRLVDLDGKTWDGTQLNSKYRPMYDAQGRNEMMAITMGWLIDAPKFDLDKHDAEVRAKVIDEFVNNLRPMLNTYVDRVRLDEVARLMKEGVEHGKIN